MTNKTTATAFKQIRARGVPICGIESADPAATIKGCLAALNGKANDFPITRCIMRSDGEIGVMPFPPFTEETKSMAAHFIDKALDAGASAILVNEAWVRHITRETMKPGDAVVPPRLCPDHTDALVIAAHFTNGRRLLISAPITKGEGTRTLEEWSVFDSSTPGHSVKRVHFESTGVN